MFFLFSDQIVAPDNKRAIEKRMFYDADVDGEIFSNCFGLENFFGRVKSKQPKKKRCARDCC